MNNDDFLDSQQDIDAAEADPPAASDLPETKNIAPVWYFVIAVAAVVVLAVLLYPQLQPQANSTADEAIPSPETQPALTGSEATAQTNPDSAEAQFQLGNSYAQSGQWPQAVTAYQKTIELDPSYQAAYANLGVVYYQTGQFDRAASQYEKALELDPDDTEVAYNLGVLYLQQALGGGEQLDNDLLNQAVAQLESVQESNPDLAEPYFSLGVAYSFLNREEEAIQSFEAFLARDSGEDPRASQEAKRYLETLQDE